MGFKVTSTNISSSETSSEIDLLSDLDLKRDVKDKIKQDVGEFLVESILSSVHSLSSPISGGSYKKTLSKDYKKEKIAEGGSGVPDLELSGTMLDELGFKKTKDGIKLGVFGSAALRADGHNNLSGKSDLPERKFLPDIDENFKSDIQSGIEEIINDNLIDSASLNKSDFKDIESSSDLYAILKDQFPDLSRAEIKNAVLRNDDLVELLDGLDLLDLL